MYPRTNSWRPWFKNILALSDPLKAKMTYNKKLENISAGVLLVYLAAYFFVPYKPWQSPISLHTPFLGLGLILYFLRIFPDILRGGFYFPRDLVFFTLAAVFFMISSGIVHCKEFSRQGVQAYTISFLCFIFVRGAVRNLNLNALFFGMKVYLIVSGILILLQIKFAGPFFVAGFGGQMNSGKGVPGWGFGNTLIWAGGAMAWMLSIILTRYALSCNEKSGIRARLFDLSALGLGAIGLFYTLNRGAWVGMALAMLLLSGILIRAGLFQKSFLKGLAVLLFFVSVSAVVLRPNIYKMHEKLSFIKSFMHADAYEISTKVPVADKGSIAEKVSFMEGFPEKPRQLLANDASTLTRLRAWGVALDGIKTHPFWGLGIGQFPGFYEKAFPRLFPGLEWWEFDPNTKQIPHNSYLYYSVEAGLLPAAFLFLFIIILLVNAFRLGVRAPVFPFFIGAVTLCVWILTCDYIIERIFWIALGLAAGFPPTARQNGQKTPGFIEHP
ncbi:MAG: hypothetical protein A2X28_01925 [Elusimicrobia bacterium GWA2_56_46]|nr:MAG: hypothetical protein A2X28_01925 [Elusimicrobia bacterium GWA2_56_46]OGR55471.1 MAG: hypothetical protein A2X39_01040 [Elusimicrobia bacterium GWC2_56_31]